MLQVRAVGAVERSGRSCGDLRTPTASSSFTCPNRDHPMLGCARVSFYRTFFLFFL